MLHMEDKVLMPYIRCCRKQLVSMLDSLILGIRPTNETTLTSTVKLVKEYTAKMRYCGVTLQYE
jgi:hypothetical protein